MAGVLKGDIYSVDFGSRNSGSREQMGFRPGLVVSANHANSKFPVVTIAPITSQIKTFSEGYSLILPPENPLPLRSEVLLFQMRTFDIKKLISFKGSLSDSQMIELNILITKFFDI